MSTTVKMPWEYGAPQVRVRAEAAKPSRGGDDAVPYLLSADDILREEYPEPVWAVPGLLPVGLSLLAGRPKRGKSWLALQIAFAVASGGVVLGRKVERGRVLYLALEDPPRRLQERMLDQGWTEGLSVDFLTAHAFHRTYENLADADNMSRFLALIRDARYRLVVIDTFSRSFSVDQNDVQAVTRALSAVQEEAGAIQCAVLLIDHHNKLGNEDAIDAVLGSTAKGAIADCIWGLFREQGKAGAKLKVIGREVEEQSLALTWDGLTRCWQCEGDADAMEITNRRKEIMDALETLGRSQVGTIADAIGQPKSHTFSRLQDLCNAGLVCRERVDSKVYYSLKERSNCNTCNDL